jgi:hypothetical protein
MENDSIRLLFEEEAPVSPTALKNFNLNRLSLARTFLSDASTASSQIDSWEIVSIGKKESNKLLHSLSRKWKDLFKLDLKITSK